MGAVAELAACDAATAHRSLDAVEACPGGAFDKSRNRGILLLL
jgi:hypothetical protein